jgi:hypothetical protein
VVVAVVLLRPTATEETVITIWADRTAAVILAAVLVVTTSYLGRMGGQQAEVVVESQANSWLAMDTDSQAEHRSRTQSYHQDRQCLKMPMHTGVGRLYFSSK